MPKIIIRADLPGSGDTTTLTERVVAENIESPHYVTQLVERLVWAVSDAEALESTTGEQRRSRPKVRRIASVLVATVAASLAFAAAAVARPPARIADASTTGVALQWYDITNQTVNAAAFPEPITQSRAWSVSWLAAARAVRGRHDASFEVAALAQALHDTLVAQVPSQQAELDSDLATTLAQVPDGPGKEAGIAAGIEQAANVLAERQGDGLDTASVDLPFTPPPAAPGVWQPTPPAYAPALRAGEGNGRPFLLQAADQFDPGPPPSLTSRTYLSSLAEVQAYGSATSTVRTPAETDVALFWEPAINIQYVQLVRGVLADTDRPLRWQARFVAAFNVITTDAQIAIYNAKFKYRFWRPVTAIRSGAVDPDPSWTPLFTTPRYPEWPSGHGGVAGAAQAVLTAFAGVNAPAPITVTSPTDPGSTHAYRNWAQITREVIDARVWEGIHFRFSDDVGAQVGAEVAAYDLSRLRSIGLGGAL